MSYKEEDFEIQIGKISTRAIWCILGAIVVVLAGIVFGVYELITLL